MEESWYKNGLSFSCTGCGKCCTGAPGYVWVEKEEMEQIADYLKISLQEFMQKYVRRVGNRFSLTESKKTFDCVFLREKKCQIYPVRPTQCKTYPWWPNHLSSPQAWQEAAKWCEGITSDAPLVPYSKIEEEKLIQLGAYTKEKT